MFLLLQLDSVCNETKSVLLLQCCSTSILLLQCCSESPNCLLKSLLRHFIISHIKLCHSKQLGFCWVYFFKLLLKIKLTSQFFAGMWVEKIKSVERGFNLNPFKTLAQLIATYYSQEMLDFYFNIHWAEKAYSCPNIWCNLS